MARGCVHDLKDWIRRVNTSLHTHSATFLSSGATCSGHVGDAARVGWEEEGGGAQLAEERKRWRMMKLVGGIIRQPLANCNSVSR